MTIQNSSRIDFLTTGVGRGHRFYLEGLHHAVNHSYPETETTLFCAPDISGALARPGWRLINSLYRRGSKSDWFGSLYNRLRSDTSATDDSVALRVFGAGLRRWWRHRNRPLVVDHPLLVKLLSRTKDRSPLIYMHGEMVAPNESLITGADLIITPTETVKEIFFAAGTPNEKIIVTGLCIEKSLVGLASRAHELRRERIENQAPITGAFFTSGAEPIEHCTLLVEAARSALKQNQKVIVFAACGGRLERMFREAGLEEVGLTLQTYTSIPDDEAKLSSVFTELDYFLAPPHERTNWALGLGLPFFMLLPCYGSFAPLNRDLAIKYAHAKTLTSANAANSFGEKIKELQSSGELEAMNSREAGAFLLDINGFERGANAVIKLLEKH